MRFAIVRAGHASNWFSVRDFYRRLYSELGSAIADGRIKGRGIRASANPPVTGTVVARTLRAWGSLMRFLFWDVMNKNIGGPRPDGFTDLALMGNWLEDIPFLPKENRDSYAVLLERDTRPSNVVTLTGWGKTLEGKAVPKEWFRCPIISFKSFLRADVGSDANYGFVVTVPKDAIIEIGDGKNPPLYKGNPRLDRHAKNLHFDSVVVYGETARMYKRRVLNSLLGGIDAIMPYFFIAVLFAVVGLAVAFVRRRDRKSFVVFAIPVLGLAFAIGYSGCLALGYVFLQCQYRAIYIYLIPSVTVYWVSGGMAIAFAMAEIVRLIKRRWTNE